jgi:hypothetical protein
LYRYLRRKSGNFRIELIFGTKDEFRIFEEENFNFSLLVPVLNPKITTFSPLVPVQSLQKIEEKNSKKVFLGICAGPNTVFLDLKNFF